MTQTYLNIALIGQSESGKTKIYNVRNINETESLGIIKWYPRWREYCYFQKPEVVMSATCLIEVAEKVSELTKDHKRQVRNGF